MYIMPEMLSIGMQGKEWPSDSHMKVAEFCLLSNSQITTADELQRCCGIICDIPVDDIEKVNVFGFGGQRNTFSNQ